MSDQICPECNSTFKSKRNNQIFCNSKCTNSFNVKRWRLKNKKDCPKCNSKMEYDSLNCLNCKKDTIFKKKTIKEYKAKLSMKNKHPSWANAHVRTFCKSWNSNLKSLPCQKCEYKMHIEFCHIKPISSFEESSTLGDVNSEDNIVILCRNCHWEFDNNIIKLSDIPARNNK